MPVLRRITILLCLFSTLHASAQYKDLEGVFFGKVVGIGAGGSLLFFSQPEFGFRSGITVGNYSIVFNNKFILTSRLAFAKKLTMQYAGNNGFTNYTQNYSRNIAEYAVSARFAITPDGLDRPTSVFFVVEAGSFLGDVKVIDSRYGDLNKFDAGGIFGLGLAVYQQLSSHLLLFADPSYRLVPQSKSARIYLGENGEQRVRLNHAALQFGLMYLIGRRQ